MTTFWQFMQAYRRKSKPENMISKSLQSQLDDTRNTDSRTSWASSMEGPKGKRNFEEDMKNILHSEDEV
jgi:uncharacterized alpha/beta hydrolase family protein